MRALSRWQASGLHLLISVVIAVTALAGMLLVWYPQPLFQAAGGNDLVMILVAVDVVIGPLITLVVFKSGKRGMRFDLWVIGMLQVAALAYGAHIIYLARPGYIVYVKDRFEVVTQVEIDPKELAAARRPEFRRLPLGGPVMVAADFPTDRQEMNQLVFAAMAGLDLQHFPKYWVPYAERKRQIVSKAVTLDELRRTEYPWSVPVDEWLRNSGIREQEVRFVALRARRAWVGVLLDVKTAEPVKMLLIEQI
jgi:hypothetical protein